MIFIGYTTHERGEGDAYRRAAETLLDELRGAHPRTPLRLEPLERKHDLVHAIDRAKRERRTIEQLHLLGPSSIYGVTFGSPRFPEELSRHEWRRLQIPFAEGASAYFHACRSARWIAPFFARTFGIRAFGYEGETTVSRSRDYVVPHRARAKDAAYVVAPAKPRPRGRIEVSLRALIERPMAEPMVAFEPDPHHTPVDFDSVADAYDRTFSDARFRPDELAWFHRRFERLHPRGSRLARVLDLGCGNGALLRALAPRLELGVGVDSSRRLLELARSRSIGRSMLHFEHGRGPELAFPDGTFDFVVTQRSFRFLDWDPVLAEIRRVLAPGGRFLLVEEVERTSGPFDVSRVAQSSVRAALRPFQNATFARDLATLERLPAWTHILEQNPLRTETEVRAYLESRFPGRRLETLSVGALARVVAFDSGPLDRRSIVPGARH